MNEKIRLIHPHGKKAVNMDKIKYDIIKKYLLACLKSGKKAYQKEIKEAITQNIKQNKIEFQGSIDWYLEWVKLDLEAKREIFRIGEKSPYKYSIAKSVHKN